MQKRARHRPNTRGTLYSLTASDSDDDDSVIDFLLKTDKTGHPTRKRSHDYSAFLFPLETAKVWLEGDLVTS